MPTVVGGLQFSSAAWRIEVRDQWIGWDDATARVICRRWSITVASFWLRVHIKNLASATWPRTPAFAADWQAQYGVTPAGGLRGRRSIAALVIGRQIGWSWESRGGAAMIVSIAAMERGASGSSCIR